MTAVTISVILEPKKINYVTVSIVSPSICHEVMGPGHILGLLQPVIGEAAAEAKAPILWPPDAKN